MEDKVYNRQAVLQKIRENSGGMIKDPKEGSANETEWHFYCFMRARNIGK